MIGAALKTLKALNSDAGPWQIAFAGALALVIGFTPLWSVHNLLILLMAFIFRVHFGTFVVFWGVFSGIAYLLDPWFHQIGLNLLSNPAWKDMWTGMYQNDYWLVSHFNHTITLGSLVVSVIAFFPAAVIFRLSIVKYRASMMPWMNKLKVLQVLKGSKLYQLYERIEG